MKRMVENQLKAIGCEVLNPMLNGTYTASIKIVNIVIMSHVIRQGPLGCNTKPWEDSVNHCSVDISMLPLANFELWAPSDVSSDATGMMLSSTDLSFALDVPN
eukprot:CAMPEP_0115320276 /NCGR_PEP_ID=MMETSP0270-20121206/80232_1 /TAXON_ID=71861 /ORGANISM="Scrippsiella trochoidea, Strain CCMP3099" /LENGTH=102 /DNA_ID=CAMNT_0002740063 /DNA_START=159 /DNA_END=467 /DNA_ORIENTATION=+